MDIMLAELAEAEADAEALMLAVPVTWPAAEEAAPAREEVAPPTREDAAPPPALERPLTMPETMFWWGC